MEVRRWGSSTRRALDCYKRDQLRKASGFLGTLLHELEHAASGHGDGTLEFEDALTARMGIVAQLLVMASFNEGQDGQYTPEV